MAYKKLHGESSEWSILRNRKMAAEAELSELDLKERKGELHSAPVILAVFTNLITEAKSRMQSIPGRVSDQLVGLTDRRKIQRILDDEIDLALRRTSQLRAEDFVSERKSDHGKARRKKARRNSRQLRADK
jgi:hypothetical protein